MGHGSGTLASLSYTRDSNGQLTSSTPQGLPGGPESYSYDKLNRLTQAGTSSYAYDAAGNLTQANGATNTFDAANELTGSQGATFSYDPLGDRTNATPTSGPATTYAYNQAKQLTGANPGGGQALIYTYNGDGLRTTKTSGATTANYSWDTTSRSSDLLSDGATNYIYGPDGTPLEQIDNQGSALYYHHDQIDSTRMLTDRAGALVTTYTYDAYGNQTSMTGSAATPLGYAGQYTDGETGLQFLRARYYDSRTGQLVTRDPIEARTHQAYSYASDNPANATDPSGLLAFQACVGGTGSFGFVTIDLNVCYVSTPGGDGLAGSAGAALGAGFGANVHAGAGVSNACAPSDYSGMFETMGASATSALGGYENGFIGPSSHGTIVGETTGITAGYGADVGLGASETGVIPF